MPDGFLGRWSQRKQAVREGKPLAEPVPPAPQPSTAPTKVQPLEPGGARAGSEAEAAAPPAVQPPPLTLQDAAALGAESDYAPFVARGVAPEVRNAAMKKLFTDPHYNVMDRLDTYIDDYSVPDPLPVSMLRQMASAKFLKLFDEAPEAPDASAAVAGLPLPETDSPMDPHPEPDARPEAASALASPTLETEDDHTDLRLQPNHAAGREASGRGAQ